MAKCRCFVGKWWLNKETASFCWDIPPSSLAFFISVMFGGYSMTGGGNKTPDFLCNGHSSSKETIADKSPLKHFPALFHFRHLKALQAQNTALQ